MSNAKEEDRTSRSYMEQQLDAFMVAFTGKHYLPQGEVSNRAARRRARNTSNPLKGMDALWRELDERLCIELPKGTKYQDIAFVKGVVAPYRLTTCYLLSAVPAWHQQTMPIDAALDEIIGTSSTTIISFLPGKLAYFEGHGVGDRWLCQRK